MIDMSRVTCYIVPMSLRHGLLDLLAGEPQSGYDLARFFEASMGNVWPAQHSQIYPELGKLVAEGLITQVDEGPRGRKLYQTTPEGIDALRTWLRESPPDYSVRYEALLRIFTLWVLPTDEALAYLERDRAEYRRHLAQIETAIGEVEWSKNPINRGARLTIEFGRRFYATLIEWIDWAAEQVRSGTLEPGGPLPTI
ncbi:MAG TPA: PadR family transcriptional regulator [Acidimicrobiaceae bacterium]|nr:PadR family transcriptional regulator [Acidimicrobiaceae bacterium]